MTYAVSRRSFIRSVFAGTVALSSTGCGIGQWPPMRGGGMAEVAPAGRSHLVVASQGSGKSALFVQVANAEEALDALIERGAMTYTPGDATLARKLCIRIRREIAGDLLSEAETDMIELTDRLSVIDRRLAEIEIRLSEFGTTT